MADKSWDDQYISKTDAIKLAIISVVPHTNSFNIHDFQRSFEKTIGDFTPSADVQPVVRGEWLTGNDNPRTYGRIRAMCGRCGAFALAEMINAGSYEEQLSNFCPNCGADMRTDGGA